MKKTGGINVKTNHRNFDSVPVFSLFYLRKDIRCKRYDENSQFKNTMVILDTFRLAKSMN